MKLEFKTREDLFKYLKEFEGKALKMATKNVRNRRLIPNGIPRYIRCYDTGGEGDRYTVVFTKKREEGVFMYLGMNSEPFHGIGQHGYSPTQIDVNKSGFAPAMGRKCHLGKRIPFTELPPQCQKLVSEDYVALWNL